MDMTLMLTGMLPAIVLISAPLSALLALLLLWLYRRAVIRAMNTGYVDAAVETGSSDLELSTEKLPPLTITIAGTESSKSTTAKQAYKATSASLRRLATVYTIAGLSYAAVFTVPWMVEAGGGFVLTRFLWLLVCHAWPTVIAVILVTATTRRARFAIAAAYFAILILIVSVIMLRNPGLGPGSLVFFWFFVNAAATIMLAAFLAPRIRAVGPLVLAFVVIGVSGALLIVAGAGSDENILRAIAEVGYQFGIGAGPLFVLLNVLGFVLLSLVGWWLLTKLGSAYARKRMSDNSLMLDSLFLLFGILQSITLVFDDWRWIFTGLVAFLVFKITTALGFSWLRNRPAHASPKLLLLRVFSLGSRSERLFRDLSKRWLRAGEISLIAGPDLAMRTVEPHEFMEFAAGRLSQQFIGNDAELDLHLAERDTVPDPDGRYRVNEFFCRPNTWRSAMRKLAAKNDAVLMDLRSFSPDHQGCLYEIEQLLAAVPLSRILLLVDDTTNLPFFEQSLQALWLRIPFDSPNRGKPSATIRVFRAERKARESSNTLVARLFEACDENAEINLVTYS